MWLEFMKIEISSLTDFHLALERIQELKGCEPGSPEALERDQLTQAIDQFDAENLAYKSSGDAS